MIPEQLRLMAVHAHPDDESSKGAATMARYVDEGVDVLVVTCTGGERGSILNPALKDRKDIEDNISEIRRAEMDRARAVLGVRQHWLGFVDSGLPEGDPLPPLPDGCFALVPIDEAVERLVRRGPRVPPARHDHLRRVRRLPAPRSHPHPRDLGRRVRRRRRPRPVPRRGAPWQVLKLYYDVGFSMERTNALHNALLEKGLESPFEEWFKRREEWLGKRRRPTLTTRVPVADWFERRDAALLAHATQVDPNGWFFSIPLDLQREVWPTEDFELARSLVDSTIPEDDLFAGVRDRVEA